MSDARNDAIVAYDNPMRDDNLAIGYRALKVNGFGDGWDSRSAEVAALHAVIAQVTNAARAGLDDCDEGFDMSALWVLETLMPSTLAALAAAHTTDLREQSKHYAVKPMNSDDGRDE